MVKCHLSKAPHTNLPKTPSQNSSQLSHTHKNFSTSHCSKITKLDSSSMFGRCLSFWDECISGEPGSNIRPPGVLVTTCKIPHSKIHYGFLTILKSLSTSQLSKIMQLTKSGKLPRHGLRKLLTNPRSFDIFKWGLLPIVKQTRVKRKI